MSECVCVCWQAGGDCPRPAEAGPLRHTDHGEPWPAALHHGDVAHHRLVVGGSAAGAHPHPQEAGPHVQQDPQDAYAQVRSPSGTLQQVCSPLLPPASPCACTVLCCGFAIARRLLWAWLPPVGDVP